MRLNPPQELRELATSLARTGEPGSWPGKLSEPGFEFDLPQGGAADPPAPRRLSRCVLTGVVATLVLVALWTATSGRGAAGALIANAVMVRPIENLSGDPSLDETGRWATYLVSNALSGIDTVRVVSADEVNRILRSMESPEQLALAIHEELVKSDPGYHDLTAMMEIHPLEVTVLPSGAFREFYRRKQEDGADLAQSRPPRMNASDAIIGELTGLAEKEQITVA